MATYLLVIYMRDGEVLDIEYVCECAVDGGFLAVKTQGGNVLDCFAVDTIASFKLTKQEG